MVSDQPKFLEDFKAQFGDKILKKTHLYEWYKKCLKKQKAVENEAHQPCQRRSVAKENILVIRCLIEGIE